MAGIGIDMVDIARVSQARFFDRLSEYILRGSEFGMMEKSRDRVQYLASRLAVKEAVVKAFPQKLNLQDIEIIGQGGPLTVNVQHAEADNFDIHVSLSHTPELAVGVAMVSSRS